MSQTVEVEIIAGGISPADFRQLTGELQGEGVLVRSGGRYERRSIAGDLVPIIIAIATIGAAASREVALGVVVDQGTEALKKVARKVLGRRSGDDREQPGLKLIHRAGANELIVNMPLVEDGDELEAMIDGAFLHARKSGRRTEIWYDKDIREWETFEEAITRRARKQRRGKSGATGALYSPSLMRMFVLEVDRWSTRFSPRKTRRSRPSCCPRRARKRYGC